MYHCASIVHLITYVSNHKKLFISLKSKTCIDKHIINYVCTYIILMNDDLRTEPDGFLFPILTYGKKIIVLKNFCQIKSNEIIRMNRLLFLFM